MHACILIKTSTLVLPPKWSTHTTTVATPTAHLVQNCSTSPWSRTKEPTTTHYGAIVGARALSHHPPGHLIVRPDLIAAALEYLDVPEFRKYDIMG